MATPEKSVTPQQAKQILLCLVRADQPKKLEPGIKVGNLGDPTLKDIMLDAGGYAMTFSQAGALALTRIRTPKGAVFEGSLPIRSTIGVVEEARLRTILEKQKEPDKFEVRQVWQVLHGGVPVGGRLDQGVGKKGLAFPSEIYRNLKGFATEEEAKACKERLEEYQADLAAKDAMRKGRPKHKKR